MGNVIKSDEGDMLLLWAGYREFNFKVCGIHWGTPSRWCEKWEVYRCNSAAWSANPNWLNLYQNGDCDWQFTRIMTASTANSWHYVNLDAEGYGFFMGDAAGYRYLGMRCTKAGWSNTNDQWRMGEFEISNLNTEPAP